eukprot:COSAG05_NODE_13581_length_424_cov_1.575385_1_plen_43_part_10
MIRRTLCAVLCRRRRECRLHCLKTTQDKAKSEHQPVRQEATEG